MVLNLAYKVEELYMLARKLITSVRQIKTRTLTFTATLGLVLGGAGLPFVLAGTAHAATCAPTGFVRDSINLTAAQIGGTVRGTLNSTGCNIGVYFDKAHPGSVQHANIFGANYFGVVVDGGQGNVHVNIQQSSIHNIGEVPFNGTQHGNAIYYYSDNASGNVTGVVSQNHVYQYQKGGIIVNGPNTRVNVINNTVNGLGPVNFIAQNGIQISRGASGNVMQNTVTGNAYTGTNNAVSTGVLIYGGCGDPLVTGVTIAHNTLRGNDVGAYAFNGNADCTSGPATPTDINIDHNIISNDAVTNVSGNGSPQGYQAGVTDAGNGDKITFNLISGTGYAPQNTASVFVTPIDVSAPYSVNPFTSHNLYNGRVYNP